MKDEGANLKGQRNIERDLWGEGDSLVIYGSYLTAQLTSIHANHLTPGTFDIMNDIHGDKRSASTTETGHLLWTPITAAMKAPGVPPNV